MLIITFIKSSGYMAHNKRYMKVTYILFGWSDKPYHVKFFQAWVLQDLLS